MGKIKKLAKKIGRGIKKIGKKIGKAFKGVFGGITNKLGPLGIIGLMMFMGPAGQAFANWGGAAKSGFGNFIKFTGDAMNWVGKAPNRAWNGITDMVSSTWNGMTTKLGGEGSYWDSIVSDYNEGSLGLATDYGVDAALDVDAIASSYFPEGEGQFGDTVTDDFLGQDALGGKTLEAGPKLGDRLVEATTPSEEGFIVKGREKYRDWIKDVKEKQILGTKTTVGDAMWGTSAAFKGYGIYNAFNPTDADLGSSWYNRNLDDANNMLSLASDQGSRTLPTTPISLDFARPLDEQMDFFKDRFITANGFLPSLQLRNSINDITPYGTNFDEYLISNLG